MKKNNIKTRREVRLRRSAKIARMVNTSLILSVFSLSYALLYPVPFSVSADNNTYPVTFQVNVKETLSVSVTTPDTWASGKPTATSDSGFLRNTVSLSVTSNNADGFTASMYADTSDTTKTSLVNTIDDTATLPTMDGSQQRSVFKANHWGYSLDVYSENDENYIYNNKIYNETDAGNSDSYYHPLTTRSNPETILTGDGATTGSRQIYFGAKADSKQAAGTYTGSVVISVVTGEVKDGNTGNEPTVPDNPATLTDDNPDTTPTYISQIGDNGVTVYTTRSSNSATTPATSTVTTQVTDGDVTSSYPLGVKENVSTSISSGSSIATGLAVTATTAAATGLIFFIIAKRREDDDEEEQ